MRQSEETGRVVGAIADPDAVDTRDDRVVELEEAAQILGISPETLRKNRQVPRVRYPGRGTGKRSKPLYLKSQLLAYARRYLTHRVDEQAVDAVVRRAAAGASDRAARHRRRSASR